MPLSVRLFFLKICQQNRQHHKLITLITAAGQRESPPAPLHFRRFFAANSPPDNEFGTTTEGSSSAKQRHVKPKLTDQERTRLRQRLTMLSHSKTKEANRGQTYLFTQSHSLLAESIHSALDMTNQICLLVGNHVAMRNPDSRHPYGFGNMRYVASLISGCAIFGFGCGLSVYSGVIGLINPSCLQSLPLALGTLCCSASLQSISLARAIREIRLQARRENANFFEYVRSPKMDPSLKVVLYEDASSIIGVSVAFLMVSLSHFTGMSSFDSCGSILIGILLGNAAVQIIFANANHLVGRSLPEHQIHDVVAIMEQDRFVRKVHDVKATYVGVTDSVFKAEIDYDGREITKAYLQEKCDLPQMLKEVNAFKSEKELEEFMMNHGEKLVGRMGDNVDRLEERVQEKHPSIRHLDLEPM
uniref:Zinc transporter 9 n=1 Tax=Globodera pallida TaxID=36090 RepID=A0A183BKE3_GLOPA